MESATTGPVQVRNTGRTALLRRLPWAIAMSFRQLLHVVLIRYFVAFVRYVVLVHVFRRLRVFQPAGGLVAEHTISHNRRGMVDLSVARSESLIRPISVIDRVAHEIDKVKVLCIGPRTEGELLNLWAYGFDWRNIRGLDLISYSSRIDLGDMHAIPYPDNSFDVIMLGWVIGYSNRPSQVAAEVIRVARAGAVVAVGQEHHPLSDEQVAQVLGYQPGAASDIVSTSAILGLFDGSVETVFMRHDPDRGRQDQVGSVVAIFSIRK